MPLPLSSLQADFAAAVRAAARPVPPTVTSHTGPRPKRRFDVYRNNVYASLINVLEARFPVTARIVGKDFFRAMARVYVEQDPPRSPVLLEWGGDFPDFVAAFEAAQDLAYLPDVARLEWARQAAYHAADATPLEADAFAGVAPGATASLVLALHPSAWALDSRYAIVSIWEANSADGDVGPLDVGQAESALVLRPHLDVNVHRIPDGGAAFVTALAEGLTLGAAYEVAHAAAPGFDLAANLAGLIRAGAIAGFAPAA